MPSLSEKATVEETFAILGQVDDFGVIDLAKRASGSLIAAKTRIRRVSQMGMTKSIDITVDTTQFEEPPIFTIELNDAGPRVYVHGISGELAVMVTVHDDGSVHVDRYSG